MHIIFRHTPETDSWWGHRSAERRVGENRIRRRKISKKRGRDGCGMRERIFYGARKKYEYEQEIGRDEERERVVCERENVNSDK